MKPMRLIPFLLLLSLSACGGPSDLPPLNINITNTNTNQTTTSVIFGAPVPSAEPGCLAIARLQIQAPTQMRVREVSQLSVTPLGTDGNKRDPHCDETDGVRWSGGDPAISIASPQSFVTPITAQIGPTNVTIKVSVGKAEGSVEIKVVS